MKTEYEADWARNINYHLLQQDNTRKTHRRQHTHTHPRSPNIHEHSTLKRQNGTNTKKQNAANTTHTHKRSPAQPKLKTTKNMNWTDHQL